MKPGSLPNHSVAPSGGFVGSKTSATTRITAMQSQKHGLRGPRRISLGRRDIMPRTAYWCGIFAVLLYFLRGTVFPFYLRIPASALIGGNISILVAAASIAVFGAGTWRMAWVFVLLAFAAGLSQAEQFYNSALRFAGLAALIIGIGPLVVNPATVALRATAWRWVVQGLPWLAGIFVIWYALRLPNFGSGFFSGFMNQCMLAGPIAGMGGTIALVHAFQNRSRKWGLLAALSIIPVLASGSRVATLATAAAFCFIIIRRKPALGVLGGLFLAGAIVAFITQPETTADSSSLTGALTKKGTVNTRAELWASRIEEFKSSPLFGIGVAMGTGGGTSEEAGGTIRVEPGSSYLAILAMTGFFGTAAFCVALGLLLAKLVRLKSPHVDVQIISAMGVFLAVHGVAEGWVLAFGSPLAFLFWLWLGKLGDVADQPVRVQARSRVRQLKQVRVPQPVM